jgi:threonine/homoserine/homoserine lactone efflux protein
MDIVIPNATSIGVFSVAAILLLLTPGPAVLYIVARSVEQGRIAGLASVFGITTGTLVHVLAAALGLSALLNPKTALFFLAFLPQFVDSSRGAVASQIVFLGLLFTLMGLTSDGLYALVAATAGRWVKRNGQYLRWEPYVTGGVFIGLGVTAALAGNERK